MDAATIADRASRLVMSPPAEVAVRRRSCVRLQHDAEMTGTLARVGAREYSQRGISQAAN